MKHFFLSAPSFHQEPIVQTLRRAVFEKADEDAFPFSFLEKQAPHTVMLFSDSQKIIEEAAARGFRTFFLPKRNFPMKDTFSVLSLSLFETIAVILTESCRLDDFSPLYEDRRALFFQFADTAVLSEELTDDGLTQALENGDWSETATPTESAESLVLPEEPEEPTELTLTDVTDPPKTTYTVTASFSLDNSEPYSSVELIDLLYSDPSETIEEAPTVKPTPLSHFVFEWIELFTLSLAAVVLLMVFFFRHSPVSGTSMVPTLENGDVLLLTQVGYTVEGGDIVILQTPQDDLRRPLVKRVIATEGQKIRINFETWEIFINGILLEEHYLDHTDKSECMKPYMIFEVPHLMGFERVDKDHLIYEATVPEHKIFVLGDNRQNSKDSRTIGFIDERYVIGEVIFRLLPFSSAGTVAD